VQSAPKSTGLTEKKLGHGCYLKAIALSAAKNDFGAMKRFAWNVLRKDMRALFGAGKLRSEKQRWPIESTAKR
jgi:hypothetical protein